MTHGKATPSGVIRTSVSALGWQSFANILSPFASGQEGPTRMPRPTPWRRWSLLLPLWLGLSACASLPQAGHRTHAAADPTLYRFVFTGDSRGDYKAKPPVYLEEELLSRTAGYIQALEPRPEFVIFNGDMVAKTTFTQAPEVIKRWHQVFQEPLKAAGIKVYIAPGNHVVDQKKPCPPGETCYISLFNRSFPSDSPKNGPAGYEGVSYSFTQGNVHFVTVTSFMSHDGPDHSELTPAEFTQPKSQFEYFVNEANRNWLQQDLATDRSPFTVFFTHVPPYAVGPHHEDKKGMDAHPANRDALAGILVDNGVDIVLASHEHLYARADLGPENPVGSGPKGPLPEVVVGSVSAPLNTEPARADMVFAKYLATYGYLVADVKKDRIEFQMFNGDNQPIDFFTIKAKR